MKEIPALIREICLITEQFGLPAMKYGHIGDGNLHVALFIDVLEVDEWQGSSPPPTPSTGQRSGWGDGQLRTRNRGGRAAYMTEQLGCGALSVMRAIKEALDPKGILNPGKLGLEIPTPGGEGMTGSGDSKKERKTGEKARAKTETTTDSAETAGISIDPRAIGSRPVRDLPVGLPRLRDPGLGVSNSRGRVMVVKALGEGLSPRLQRPRQPQHLHHLRDLRRQCPAGANPPRSSRRHERGSSPRAS